MKTWFGYHGVICTLVKEKKKKRRPKIAPNYSWQSGQEEELWEERGMRCGKVSGSPQAQEGWHQSPDLPAHLLWHGLGPRAGAHVPREITRECQITWSVWTGSQGKKQKRLAVVCSTGWTPFAWCAALHTQPQTLEPRLCPLPMGWQFVAHSRMLGQ